MQAPPPETIKQITSNLVLLHVRLTTSDSSSDVESILNKSQTFAITHHNLAKNANKKNKKKATTMEETQQSTIDNVTTNFRCLLS